MAVTLPLNTLWTDKEMRLDYTTNSPPTSQPSFQGFAPPGVGTDQERWTIFKMTYTGNNLTRREVFFKKAWDDRSSL